MRYQSIQVLTARTLEQIENCPFDNRKCDTIKQAKAFAKYCLTDAYQHSAEFSEPMTVSRVIADGEILEEYYR